MFRSSYQIAKVWGIPIRVHISLILMALVLARPFGWGLGLTLGLGLAVSIVLHELGHSIVAIRKGCRVRSITLMFVGGAAQMERIPTRPLDEFLMALAGPAVSAMVGVTCLFVGRLLPLPTLTVTSNWLNVVQLLGLMNLVLVVFNLLPAFPMDGGRVLRALLTPKLGRLRATFIAVRLGQIAAVLFVILGIKWHNWVLIAVAFFVFIIGGNEYRMVRRQEDVRRRYGDGWPFGDPARDPQAPGTARVEPPPYRNGPASESEISSLRDGPGFPGRFRR